MSNDQAITQIAVALDNIHQVLIHLTNAIQSGAPIMNVSPDVNPPATDGKPDPTSPTATPNGNEGSAYLDFEIDAVILSTDDNGNPVYKGRGHPFEKYGVRIWPEVFARLGVSVEDLVPGENTISPIYTRAVLNENGNPRKIVGIAPGQAPATNNDNPVAPPIPEPYPQRDIRSQPEDDEIPF